MNPHLSVENLSCEIANTPVLRGVSFDLAKGEIGCLLGPSGCGKTTVLRSLAGFQRPSTGRILLNDQLLGRIAKIDEYQRKHRDHADSPLDGPQLTNIEIFRIYIMAYLKSRSDIHTEGRPFLVRVLSPGPTGLPVELYIFAKTTDWATYEGIQAEIFDHLLAAAHVFELRVFQEPTGLDFTNFSTQIK